MTREQAREAAAVMLGWADGKVTQYRSEYSDVWIDVQEGENPLWDWTRFIYRLKPTPVLRPWTADEVPLGAWMRFKRNPQDRVLLGWVSVQADRDMWLQEREHSTDGGLNWKPCGVEEEVK